MSATSGAGAWSKHFEGRGDIETFVFKDAELFDVSNQAKKIGQIPKGEKIIVKGSKKYEPRPIVEVVRGKQIGRVKFDSIQKPDVNSHRNLMVDKQAQTIKYKSLTPKNLGLTGIRANKMNFVGVVDSELDKLNTVSPVVKEFLREVIAASDKDGKTLSDTTQHISTKDVNIISKDFGEVCSARWFLHNYDKNLSYVEWPSNQATPLIDFYAYYDDGTRLSVSTKSGKGAAPSLTGVWASIKDKRYTGKSEAIKNLIGVISTAPSTIDGIILAAKQERTDAWRILSNLIGIRNLNSKEQVEKWLATFDNPKALFDFLKTNYYDKIGRSSSLDSIKKIYAEKGQRSGIVLSPMAYALVDELNRDRDYKNFLTRICRSANIQQVHVYINKTTRRMIFSVSEFKDSKFIFEYHANAINPGKNRIGFKIDR